MPSVAPNTFTKYGAVWGAGTTPLQIEFACIQRNGKWQSQRGECGAGLFTHYRNAISLLWPEDDHHRWSDQALESLVNEEITIFMGCGDSNKTYSMARFILVDYWTFPAETLWLISSTEYRGAELRIWGKVKELYNRGRKRHDWLAGHVLDSMHAITTDELDDDQELARSLQRGLIVVPNKKGNVNVGLSAFVGVKAPRLRHAGDEVQHMTSGFLDAYSNWYGKENFKGCMAGNPLDITDQLCTAAEPIGGWDNFEDTGKTQTWRSTFFNAKVIAFDGRDSPNFDFPDSPRPKFPYLIGKKKLEGVKTSYGEDSWNWFNQCVGKPNKSLALKRVITSRMCIQNFALNDVVWKGTPLTHIYGLDPAYGGGDRCVGTHLEFGEDANGNEVLNVHEPEPIPISLKVDLEPEEQIALFIRDRLLELKVTPKNCFYDSFGKGTMGFFFSKVFKNDCPIPVDSSAQPTERPVRFDLFVEEIINQQVVKRLKRCDEHYSKFVTEMWFSVTETIMSQQLRGLSKPVMLEGTQRVYGVVSGNRIEVESKVLMKERIGHSPDLFDCLAIGVEGARQRGFRIKRIGAAAAVLSNDEDFFEKEAREYEQAIKSQLLDHSV